MEFTGTTFEQFFSTPHDFLPEEVEITAKLQETRNILQESISENSALAELINTLYNEARVENVAMLALIEEISGPLFRNPPLPRNADTLSLSEKAGYAVYYMKFLGFASRKALEEYHKTKECLQSQLKVARANSYTEQIKRTGVIKLPELDGMKEIKRPSTVIGNPTPPVTPPKPIVKKAVPNEQLKGK